MQKLTAKRKRQVRKTLNELRAKLVGVGACAKAVELTVEEVRGILREHDEAYVQLQKWADGGLSTYAIADCLGLEVTQVTSYLRHVSPELRARFEELGRDRKKARQAEKGKRQRERERDRSYSSVGTTEAVKKPRIGEIHQLVVNAVPKYEDHPGLRTSSGRLY